MARPSKTGGKTSGAKARNAKPTKARHAAKIKRPKNSAVSALRKELQEVREQRAATAEILKVIASSPGDAQPVFDAIVVSAARLIGGFSAGVYRFVDDSVHLAATTTVSPVGDEVVRANFPRPIGDDHFRAVFGGEVVEFADTEDQSNARLKEVARVRGFRSIVFVPLKSARTSIGLIAVSRKTTGAFAAHHVELLQTFAEQAVIAIENARMFDQLQRRTNELAESLEQQAAASEVLEVISLSIGNVQPVFDKLLESATRVCGAQFGAMGLFDGEVYRRVALYNMPPAFDSAAPKEWRPGPDGPIGRVLYTGDVLRFDDLRESPTYLSRHPATVAMVEVAKARTLAIVPMLRDGKPIGSISIYRQVVRPFSDKQINLLRNFASQAVIAIENARLFNETKEALERQTATADILKVIASSPDNVQPVFNAIAESARRVVGAHSATVTRVIGEQIHLAAFTTTSEAGRDMLMSMYPQSFSAPTVSGKVVRTCKVVLYADTETEGDGTTREVARARGFRSVLGVPMLRDGSAIGAINVTRAQPGPFDENTIGLMQTLADQAVIAIQNVQLFNETQEALERQTATAEILKVIADSPSDVQPVFEAIAERSNQLMGGLSTAVYSIVDDVMHLMAFTRTRPQADAALRASFPRQLSDAPWADQIRRGEVVEIPDVDAEFADQPTLLQMARLRGFRSVLFVPLLRDGATIGIIGVTRPEPGTFAPNHVQLLQTFANQAVIAIGNVRLFDEVQARTRELTESLEQQTATSEVLEVISASPGELEPVFQKMLENATRVCGANFGMMQLWNGETFSTTAAYNVPPAFAALREGKPIYAHPQSGLSDVLESHEVVHIHDVTKGPAYLGGDPNVVQLADIGGARTVVLVPMLKDDEFIGTFTIYRQEVRPFTDKQIALVENFTKQAVIAIENTRLLRELRQRTNDLSESLEQQTATSEVLKVISNSPGELDPVFTTMLSNATRICEANFGMMYRYDNGQFHPAALLNVPPALVEYVRDRGSFLPPAGTPLDRLFRTKEVTYTVDETAESNPGAPARLGGARSLVGVPMLKENELIGAIIIYRQEVRPFTDKQVELVTSFANQAVIAIENTRLLKELRQRTEDLSLSLEELRTAQDRLIQTEKLASLGQLTAGIAHEIKNPLNFVNNFSALSSELIDEMNDVLKDTKIDDKKREEIDELTHMLKGNLEKVVQHGKRADSIVKNMLLHSREGSREHRSADINSLLDESLNLAYHGARAEKGEFNIILQRDFDADAGTIELFPQEITRAFLNLIANGVYAATRRKTEDKEPGFEPTLRATTKNLGSTVEIRIRDNGTGIPAEVREKMFNPFFTTKPAGEGTGLGLSMTHDIIVKQHGGRIDVTTEPGQFTEFTIVLPRKSNLSGGDRGKT